ncbi:helix-turn-helix domain-containing protein [Limosilactobacillus antri]|uniref:helix-turn-helix domain-containing protein n=1 Tax=Limosilactobacillus antri TaxID=227943 RepID=UPI001F589DC1|nr:helix-turn-helix transcriptional regulator [Limosilactobacillus antri]
MSEFNTRLTDLRENKGWSKTYVAKAVGLKSMQTYANWEYGRTEPDFKMLTKIAKLFDVSTDYLLSGNKDKQPKEADLADQETVFTYEGEKISSEDFKYIKRILRGGKA